MMASMVYIPLSFRAALTISRTNVTAPRWLAFTATIRDRTGAPANARSPTQSIALCRTKSSFQRRKAGLGQRRKEGRCASVEYRRLRTIHVDSHVVDAYAADGSEDVLHGVHRMTALPELGAPLAVDHFADVGANPWKPGTIGAPKHDPLPRFRRLKSELAGDPKVQADPLQHRWTGNCLPAHFDSGGSSNFSSRRIIPANLNNAAEARRESLWGRAG